MVLSVPHKKPASTHPFAGYGMYIEDFTVTAHATTTQCPGYKEKHLGISTPIPTIFYMSLPVSIR